MVANRFESSMVAVVTIAPLCGLSPLLQSHALSSPAYMTMMSLPGAHSSPSPSCPAANGAAIALATVTADKVALRNSTCSPQPR